MRFYDLVGVIFGLILLVGPQIFTAPAARRRAERLEALRSGAEEIFFEERRSLKAYPGMRRLWVWRLLGFALLASTLSDLFQIFQR